MNSYILLLYAFIWVSNKAIVLFTYIFLKMFYNVSYIYVHNVSHLFIYYRTNCLLILRDILRYIKCCVLTYHYSTFLWFIAILLIIHYIYIITNQGFGLCDKPLENARTPRGLLLFALPSDLQVWKANARWQANHCCNEASLAWTSSHQRVFIRGLLNLDIHYLNWQNAV